MIKVKQKSSTFILFLCKVLKNSVKQTNNNYIYDILILVGDNNEIKRFTKTL